MLAEFHIFIVAQIDALPPLLRAPDDLSSFPAVALWIKPNLRKRPDGRTVRKISTSL